MEGIVVLVGRLVWGSWEVLLPLMVSCVGVVRGLLAFACWLGRSMTALHRGCFTSVVELIEHVSAAASLCCQTSRHSTEFLVSRTSVPCH
jgi:hypothetical protein